MERCTSLEPWTPTSAVRDRATARRERQREQQRPAEHLRANELGDGVPNSSTIYVSVNCPLRQTYDR